MTRQIEKEKKWDLKIAFISAIVGGAIALSSNLLTLYQTNVQKITDERKMLLDRKIELIDKSTKVFYQLPGVQEMISYGVYKNLDTIKIDPVSGRPQFIPKEFLVSKELANLRGEFFATLVQDELYFGDKTRNYIKDSLFEENNKYNRGWWETPDSTYKRLLEIMMSEIQ